MKTITISGTVQDPKKKLRGTKLYDAFLEAVAASDLSSGGDARCSADSSRIVLMPGYMFYSIEKEFGESRTFLSAIKSAISDFGLEISANEV